MDVIPVNLAIEDELSEITLRRLLHNAGRGFEIGTAYGRRGFGYLRATINDWNGAARYLPFIVLTDLDQYPCATALHDDWLSEPLHANLLLRVAVREVESWLLADRSNLAQFLGTSIKHLPAQPDLIPDPKATLIDAARRSRSKEVRDRIVPRPGSTAKQGREYNACLAEFVLGHWNVAVAALCSPSLQRTVARLESFTPRLIP